jgi:diaminohydroxyphosphoribosylaminopyrimidine deaminase/5-amino-6-(5-phosphoribosylamino)uracil reductase
MLTSCLENGLYLRIFIHYSTLIAEDKYMYRCLELARQGAGYVAPNPMVGAVLVYNGQIIGEGYHEKFGEAHAEVNCIDRAVQNGQSDLIPQSILYVSLEPCSHVGKTPPCTDLIIRNKIPKVVIGSRDPFKKVDGKGIEKLKAAGVSVEVNVLDKECKELNKRFFTFHTKHRPYIILKWAQTGDGFTAPLNPPERGTLDSDYVKDSLFFEDSKAPPSEATDPAKQAGEGWERSSGEAFSSEGREASRLQISNQYSNRLVHKWRSEEAAILVGTNTALLDNPELTTRLWPGPSPVRIVIDRKLKLPPSLKLFNGQVRTIVFNTVKQEENDNLLFYKVGTDENLVHKIVNALYQLNIQSVIVEGGTKMLQSFIDEDLWDEARVITNENLNIGAGLNAPVLNNKKEVEEIRVETDRINVYSKMI